MLLEAFGLTTDNIVQQIQGMNRNVSGGSIVEMGKKYIIKGTGLIQRISDFDNLVIGYKSGASAAGANNMDAAQNQNLRQTQRPRYQY